MTSLFTPTGFGKATDFPVTQTVGSGLTGTVCLDQISTGHERGRPGSGRRHSILVPNDATEGNWLRITGLTPDGSGNLGFSMGGTNAAFNGFQLIEMGGGAPDTTPPTPNPMTWLNVPAAVGSSSITMTATTASDASGVEYLFTETSEQSRRDQQRLAEQPHLYRYGTGPPTPFTPTRCKPVTRVPRITRRRHPPPPRRPPAWSPRARWSGM